MVPDEFRGGEAPVALVTGGGRRIGAVLARALAADGWRVAVHCNASRAEAEALASEIGGLVVAADLARPDAGEAVFAQLAGLSVRCLVNNASLFEEDAMGAFAAGAWDRHMAVNARAPALLTQAFAAALDGARGAVVNMLDAKLAFPNPDFFTYTVSKQALAGLTELSARALAPMVRVNGIAPAVTLVSGPQSRENFEAVHAMNALRRGVDVAEIAGALRFILATPTLTGQVITLDGGQRFLGLSRDVQYLVEG